MLGNEFSEGSRRYVGRFAPSPTGLLHFGSLVAATASYLEARARRGKWLIRIDDIDPPREIPGSADSIVRDLICLGFEPDGPILLQSRRQEAYLAARDQLLSAGNAFWCGCTRGELPPGPYPGTCRNGLPAGKHRRAVRLKSGTHDTWFEDEIQGRISVNLGNSCGDFVIWRADGLPAYQLATGIDDADQGITQVVRGADLLESTPRQIAVRQALALPSPGYAHVPVATHKGQKLSKSNLDKPLSAQDPWLVLRQALLFLGQEPPEARTLQDLWAWAFEHWRLSRVPKVQALDVSEISGPGWQNVIL